MHLIGVTIEIYYDARPYERQIVYYCCVLEGISCFYIVWTISWPLHWQFTNQLMSGQILISVTFGT